MCKTKASRVTTEQLWFQFAHGRPTSITVNFTREKQNHFYHMKFGFSPFGAGRKQLGGLAHAGFALPFLFAERVPLSGLAGGRR